MEEMGLVQRERMAEDQRRVSVSITPKSRALARRIVPLIDAQYRELEQRIGADLLAQVYATLDQLLLRLDASAATDAT
jgi:DNA-binding MarR family transcriptional regulator